jgi:hypothetical protein
MMRNDCFCPYCDAGVEIDHSSFDYSEYFDMECPHCHKEFEVEVEAIPNYIVSRKEKK